MSVDIHNSEGYVDPTAFEALSGIEHEEQKVLRTFRPIVYGGRTYFRIADAASTDIQVHPLGRYADEGFEVILGGDCELETMIRALKFITQVLEEEAEEVFN